MKIKTRVISAILALLMLLLIGCSKVDKKDTEKVKDTTTAESTAYDYDLTKYVKLGQYLGIKYEVTTTELTDAMVQSKITEILSSNSTLKEVERAAANGDTVTVEYVGTMDGVAFNNGSTTEPVDLEVGNSGYIEGFDEGLVGITKGETKVLDLTFPDPYPNNPDLAGKAVQFTVTCSAVKETVTPEYTDEFIQTISDKYKTTDEYTKYLKKDLKKQLEAQDETTNIQSVWGKVFENATIYSCPQVEIDRFIKETKTSIESQASSYNMKLEEYLSAAYNGMTLEDFNTQLQTEAENTVKQELVLHAIINAEDIEVTDKDYKETAEYYAENQEKPTTVAELEKAYGKEAIQQGALMRKTFKFLLSNANLDVSKSNTTKEDDKEVIKLWMIISAIAGVLIIFVVIILIVAMKQKKNKKTDDYLASSEVESEDKMISEDHEITDSISDNDSIPEESEDKDQEETTDENPEEQDENK